MRLRTLDPLAALRRRCAVRILVIVCLAALASAPTRSQELKRRGSATAASGLQGVISQARLAPPLHTRLRALRFSPDSNYILLQDETNVYVMSRSPVNTKLAFTSPLALPVRFTADSKNIVVPLQNMRMQLLNIETGKAGDEKKFGEGVDCSEAALSPHAEFYACVGSHSTLRVFRVDSGEEVFRSAIGYAPTPNIIELAPFHFGLSRSEPFGYYFGDPGPQPIQYAAHSSGLKFSPSGRYLITVSTFRQVTAIDLQSRKKIGLGGSLQEAAAKGTFEFAGEDKVASVSAEKSADSELLSFPDGKRISRLNIAGAAQGTSDPRYLIHISSDAQSAEILDLETNGVVTSKISREGADVFAGQVISYAPEEGLSIRPLGSDHGGTLALLPAGPVTFTQTAIASDDLQTLVIGVMGQGAVFRVKDGQQIAAFPGLRGAWFEGEQSLFLRVSHGVPGRSDLERLEVGAQKPSESLWPVEELSIRRSVILASGPVLLSETPSRLLSRGRDLRDAKRLGYDLAGLDLKTGKQSWSRDFSEAPVAFTDPQGERVVVGWEANMGAGKKAAKRNPIAEQALKRGKITEHDTIFEVLDARSGDLVNAAFVPGGSGPEGYTSAFSAGDWLILLKDNMRITAVCLSKGDERLHLTAHQPSISSQSELLAASEDGGRLLVYDLKTGGLRAAYQFPADVVYSRFSSDGKRLLALTQYQTLYVLDLSTAPNAAAGSQ